MRPVALHSADVSKAPNLRPVLWQLHLYGGLLCFGYLIVYGCSALAFNHPGLLAKPDGARREWRAAVELPDSADDPARAEATRDALGLLGWPLPWTMRRDEGGTLRFEMERPGRHYWIAVEAGGGVTVAEEGRGLVSVLKGLHGLSDGIPGSALMNAWSGYTEITTWVVLFSVASGVFLWATRVRFRRKLVLAALTSVATSVLLVLAVLRG